MPGAPFSRAQLDAIKRQSDLVEVAREQGLVLRRRGRTYFGLAGLFHCFGCGAGGDVIRFVERVQQISFPEAVRHLARRAGITIETGRSA